MLYLLWELILILLSQVWVIKPDTLMFTSILFVITNTTTFGALETALVFLVPRLQLPSFQKQKFFMSTLLIT